MNCAICINNINYNVFTYADDLLLSSTTVTGLQGLISNHGLRFNPAKTKCMISNIEATNLAVEKTLSYLGAEIGGPTKKYHIEKRLRCAWRSFYSLQSAGLKYLGVSPETAMTILKTSVDSTLSYSCHCTSLVNFMKELDKLQANLIIVVLGLSKYCHTTHLMQATRIKPISHTIQYY